MNVLGFFIKTKLTSIARFARRKWGMLFIFFGHSPKKMNNLSSFASEASNSAAFYDELFFIRKP
jgi:hypothetical protein